MIPEPTFATVHGSPGARVRALGLAVTYWPFLLALFLVGWFLHAALPAPIPPAWAAVALLLLVLFAWAALGRAANDAGLRAKLRPAGMARAATFRWEKTAAETWRVYRGEAEARA